VSFPSVVDSLEIRLDWTSLDQFSLNDSSSRIFAEMG